jgi:hypothetical protein
MERFLVSVMSRPSSRVPFGARRRIAPRAADYSRLWVEPGATASADDSEHVEKLGDVLLAVLFIAAFVKTRSPEQRVG